MSVGHSARYMRGRNIIATTLLLGASALLASCNAPVGEAPNFQGTYWAPAQVTYPNGDGPQVVRWGPPQNYNGQRD